MGMLLNSFETKLAVTPNGSINLQLKLDYVEITLNKDSQYSVNWKASLGTIRSFSLKKQNIL